VTCCVSHGATATALAERRVGPPPTSRRGRCSPPPPPPPPGHRQEPGSADQIKSFVASRAPGVLLAPKSAVNGAEAHPLFAVGKTAFPGDCGWNFACRCTFCDARAGRPVGAGGGAGGGALGGCRRPVVDVHAWGWGGGCVRTVCDRH